MEQVKRAVKSGKEDKDHDPTTTTTHYSTDYDETTPLLLFSNSKFLKSMTAFAHYNMGEFDLAQDRLQQFFSHEHYRLEQVEIFSNILYVKECPTEISHQSHTSVRKKKYRPKTCIVVGN